MNALSQRAQALKPSPTLAISEQVRTLRAQGVDVVDLSGGDPDFPTPDHICQAAAAALARGDTHYVSSRGIPALRDAIARKLSIENGLEASAAGLVVTPGGKAALFTAIQALVEPGTDVLLPEPAWVSYRPMIELAGGRVRPVALESKEGFRLTQPALEAQLTPATRLLIVNSPNNPTGRVLDQGELDAIAQVAVSNDLVVLADEIYEKIIYDGRVHHSLAARPGMAERTVTVNGFSKSWAMTGWRLGYVTGPVKYLDAIANIHGHMATCVSSFAQAGALAALQGSQAPVAQMVAAWDRRRHRICQALAALPGIRCPEPEGAFYAFADIRGTQRSSSDLAQLWLTQAHVAVVPGSAFGAAGEGHVRLSFATSDAELERAIERLARLAGSAAPKDPL